MENTNYFIRTISKSEVPVCNILGVNIAAINMDWLLDFLKKHLEELSGDYITVANVHTTVTAYEDPTYRKIQNSGIMAIPDGGPLSSFGNRRGISRMARTTGPDLMKEIFQRSVQTGYKHYFFGSSDETLRRLKENLLRKYPGISIVGTYSPPYRPLTDTEDSRIVSTINAAEADFVWVGLGAPKQEQWMYAHQGKIRGLMIGVGAGFDYFAGNIKRAPVWMQTHNLEWLYRLIQEPRRLFKRYLRTNIKFIFLTLFKGKQAIT